MLVGQLNLNPLLKAPQMRQLDQRVSIRYQLRPLSRDEVAAYVSHRLTVAGGSAAVTFQPKALDMVHSRTQGIPRLINLICDRSLLAAFSGRTNRVTPEMVYQAAENLELLEDRPSRFGWLRRRASVVMMAAGASVSLGVAGSMVGPALRASSGNAHVRTANRHTDPAPAAAGTESGVGVLTPSATDPSTADTVVAGHSAATDQRYSVLAASFPVANLARVDSTATMPFEAVVGQLQKLGYDVRVTDVDLGDSGEWRRVMVGEFSTEADAKVQMNRVQQTPAFVDAQVIRY